MTTRILLDGGRYFEGPRWRQDRLWVSDTLARTVLSVDLRGNATQEAEADDIPCGLGSLPNGEVIVLTMFGRRLWRLAGGKLVAYADLSSVAAGTIDDMIIDGRGRAYVGDLGFNLLRGPVTDPVGRLVLVAPGEAPRVVATDLHFPNGIAVTEDGSTLFVAETSGGSIAEFAIKDDGSLAFTRRFGSFAEPDGICLDSEGAIWVALLKEDAFVRIDGTGHILERIETPGRRAVACTLGGPERRSLFLITAETTPEDLMKGVSTSRIEVCDVPVAGAGFP